MSVFLLHGWCAIGEACLTAVCAIKGNNPIIDAICELFIKLQWKSDNDTNPIAGTPLKQLPVRWCESKNGTNPIIGVLHWLLHKRRWER
jgi:hypothetical protein